MADFIINHYERHAREWDADRNSYVGSWNDKPWHDRFVAALPAEATVLDLGCGSGSPVAEYMAERGLHVTGVDSSSTLISLCRQRLPAHEWLVGDMRLLELSRRFDGLLAWDSFFHLRPDDQRRMFGVFARHAAPSAVMMFSSGPAYGESVGTLMDAFLSYVKMLNAHDAKGLAKNDYVVPSFFVLATGVVLPNLQGGHCQSL